MDWWSHQESNLDQKFRKLLFYPLNYETNCFFSEFGRMAVLSIELRGRKELAKILNL
jgi:hypothetical protein